jgi:hypothetical protein
MVLFEMKRRQSIVLGMPQEVWNSGMMAGVTLFSMSRDDVLSAIDAEIVRLSP